MILALAFTTLAVPAFALSTGSLVGGATTPVVVSTVSDATSASVTTSVNTDQSR